MSDAYLTVADVGKRFGTHQAVGGVCFDIAAGEAVVILGPSGCGKTTLLRLIAGLEVPDRGDIWMAGRQVSGPHHIQVPPHARGIGFVFQDLALWPHLTVQKSLEFVLESVRTPRSDRRAKIQDVLALVRIDHLAARYPHELSGGEQQRAALARALVARPGVLLLDEPFSSLDPELRTMLRYEVARLQRALRVTTVYVTHDREDVLVLANRAIEMRAGRIVEIRNMQKEERA